jgi:hypothetical protein
MTELDPVWQRTISKKIAQMTRVVFRLHVESIDHRDETSQLKARYESELSQIEAESRDNLARAQVEANNYHPVIERTVRSEFETKFNQTKIQFDAAHEKLEADSNRAIETATARLNDLKSRVDVLRQKSAESTQVFTAANEEIRRIHADALRRIEEQHQREIARHVADANAKYDATVAAMQKAEDTLKREFEAEIAELRRTLASSQVSAVETLTKRQADLEAAVKSLEARKGELTQMIEEFKQQAVQQQKQAEETIAQAKVLQQKMIAMSQKELADLQASIVDDQKRFSDETDHLKAEIAKEEADHEIELKKCRDKLTLEKERLQKQLEQFDAESRKSAALADQRHQKLAEEHNAKLAALDSQHANYLEEARQREGQSHEEMVALEKKHQGELAEIRSEMEKELNASLERIEEMKKKHYEEIDQIRAQQEQQMADCHTKLKENSTRSAAALEALLKEAAQLNEEIQRATEDQQFLLEELERKNSIELLILRKHHNEAMAALERSHELQLGRLELDHTAEVDKCKKQFVLDSQHLQEKSQLSLKQEMERIRHQMESQRIFELDQKQQEWAKELSDLNDEIDVKTAERKQLEIGMKREIQEKQTKITEMRKELESLEEAWKEEKRQMTSDWNVKFEGLCRQLKEEERQNEEARRMSVEDYEKKMDELKLELTAAEERKAKESTQIKAEFAEEQQRGEQEIAELKREFDRLSAEHSGKVAELESQLAETQRLADIERRNVEALRKQELQVLEDELRRAISEGKQKVQEVSLRKLELQQKQELELHEMQMAVEQMRLDAQFKISEFQRQKNQEQAELDEQHKREIELLNIELQRIHEETDGLKQRHMEEMQRIQQSHAKRREEQQDEFQKQRVKIEEDNARMASEKQAIIADMEASIQEWETRYKNREARPEDADHIQRLEELVQERQDGLEKLVVSFRRFEKELTAHEGLYQKVFSRDSQQLPLNPLSDRRGKKDGGVKSVSSAKRIPQLVTPMRPGTPRTKSPQ